MSTPTVPVFDMDGTLVDSDAALAEAFVALGVPREAITRGHVVADECLRLGVALEDYLDAYRAAAEAVRAFEGVEEMLVDLDRWAICSNKHPDLARAELTALGWSPEVALFADAFGGPKRLEPVLEAMGLAAGEVLFVGDTPHDRTCAGQAGAAFALAAWNPLAAAGEEPLGAREFVVETPAEVVVLIRSG